MLNILFLIVEPIKAFEEIWIVGDGTGYFHKGYSVLQQLYKELNDASRQRKLYIYDVQAFMCSPETLERNPLTRIRNALAYAVNKNAKLPRYLIVLVDDPLVTLGDIVMDSMRWLFSKIWCIILTRHDQLTLKTQPEVATETFMIKPLPKPSWADQSGQYTADKRKINDALEKYACTFKHFKTKNIDTINPRNNAQLDVQGTVSSTGMTVIWQFISNLIYVEDRAIKQAYIKVK